MYNTQISDIEQSLSHNQQILDKKGVNLGVTGGTLGLSLFYYYYYLYTKNNEHIDTIMHHLNKAFEGVSSDYKGYFIALDMMEIVQFLYFLKDKELIDEDINDYCEGFDDWIYKFLELKIEEKEMDPYGGIIKVGTYFLERSRDIEINDVLDRIISVIEEFSVKEKDDGNEISFQYNFLDKTCRELGKGHGITGIIYFLLRVYKQGFFQERCKELIIPAINFLLKNKKSNGVNLFSSDIENTSSYEYSNISYGDIGIGYTLYHAGKILENELYSKEGIEIMLNISQFRDDTNKKIFDANLIYGAAGIYSVFKLFEQYYPHESFTKASKYWLDKATSFNTNNTKWAGFKTFYNGEQEELQLCFDQGICGIGITLMCSELNISPDYLHFLNYNFT